jgi:hypothetical protein
MGSLHLVRLSNRPRSKEEGVKAKKEKGARLRERGFLGRLFEASRVGRQEGRKEGKWESGKRRKCVFRGKREEEGRMCLSLSLSLSLSLLLQQSSKMLYPLPPVMAQLSVTPIQTLSFYLSLSLCRRGRKWMEEMSRMNVCSVFFSERLLHAAT